MKQQPLILAVNSAEKLVSTVWEDFRELVGGAGGGIVNVCVHMRGRVMCGRPTDGHTWMTICMGDIFLQFGDLGRSSGR